MDTKLLLVICLMVCFAATNAMSVIDLIHHGEFGSFMLEHKKSYDVNSVEYTRRFRIFRENKQKVDEHNALESSFQMALNQFADMRSDEINAVYNGYNRTAPSQAQNQTLDQEVITFLPAANVVVPESVDWRRQGAVTPVKDQGRCGSCWAFVSNGALEGQHFRKSGVLVSLSEQNLVDCSTKNLGCDGGDFALAFDYVKKNGGIDTEQSYPYEGVEKNCRFSEKNIGATDKGFIRLPTADEKMLMQAVATVGPIAVAVDASLRSFHMYSGGVYDEPRCNSENEKLAHGVLVVGYGTENGRDYWLAKNSWGAKWGERGYIKMARNKNNQCGIATDAIYPLV